MSFRERLLRSLASVQPILDVPGVMVGGSQVPNLLERDVAATLVVSQDVDLVVPVSAHGQVREALSHVDGYEASAGEPSVLVPHDPERLEINFIGRDPDLLDTGQSYVLDDVKLPLLVFGLLALLEEGRTIEAGGVRVRVPRPAGLLAEKLLTERSGLKGERDLLVALALLRQCGEADLVELEGIVGRLPIDARTTLLGNLGVLSLLRPLPDMPDPTHGRAAVEALLGRLQGIAP